MPLTPDERAFIDTMASYGPDRPGSTEDAMPLTPDQQARVDRAREVLDEKRHEYDPESMAAQIGRLDYWLRDMLAIVGQLAGEPPANVSSIQRKYGG